MKKEKRPTTLQTALIGLAGTVLTVGGGLCGALVTSAVTIYQVEREQQLVSVSSTSGEQTLVVDTGSFFLSRQEAAALDPGIYYIDLENGFVLRRPAPGWEAMETLTIGEQLAETDTPCIVLCDQPVFRIRYGQPIEVESDRNSTINGHPVPEELLDLSEQIYGPPPWRVPYYSLMILNVYDKNSEGLEGLDNLAEMMLLMTTYQAGSYNKVVAPEEGGYAILQASNTLGGIRMAGQEASMTLEDWMLLAESEQAFYTLEIIFTAQSGQPLQVWDDLQEYIDEFRVIE